jgi:hypothetical protein
MLLLALLQRRLAGPLPEGAREGALFGITEQQGHFGQLDIGIAQIGLGQLLARLAEQGLEALALLGQAPTGPLTAATCCSSVSACASSRASSAASAPRRGRDRSCRDSTTRVLGWSKRTGPPKKSS